MIIDGALCLLETQRKTLLNPLYVVIYISVCCSQKSAHRLAFVKKRRGVDPAHAQRLV
jgi:hypothetical protein